MSPTRTQPGPASASRRSFLTALTSGAATMLLAPSLGAILEAEGVRNVPATNAAANAITIYKDPNCGCCKAWVEHLKKAGFVTTVRDTADMDSIKASMGVPAALASCHTAVIGKYVIEGHVPADLVTRLVTEKPVALGLAVPGMPPSSPGMETPGARKEPYKVLLFDRSGKTSVFASR